MANNFPLIIANDTNSHYLLWGCVDYNHRGLTLSEYMPQPIWTWLVVAQNLHSVSTTLWVCVRSRTVPSAKRMRIQFSTSLLIAVL